MSHGSKLEDAVLVAEQLRVAVSGGDLVEGMNLTMSFGVSASNDGAPFEYQGTFAEADEALYAAKAAGRNCVRTPEQGTEAALA